MKKESLYLLLSTIILSGCSSSQQNNDDFLSTSSIDSQSSQEVSLIESKPTEESTSKNIGWSSLEEAITFYENILITNKG